MSGVNSIAEAVRVSSEGVVGKIACNLWGVLVF